MQPLAIDRRALAQLQSLELRLLPGRALAARVVQAADAAGRGRLAIAGAVIDAQLPRHLRAGEQLRLVVHSADERRVELGLSGPDGSPAASTASAPSAPPVAPQAGGRAAVDEDAEPASPGPDRDTVPAVSLRYDTPALGALDLRFELAPEALRVSVTAPTGTSTQLAQSHARELQEALSAAAGRPVQVTVTSRREPLELYA